MKWTTKDCDRAVKMGWQLRSYMMDLEYGNVYFIERNGSTFKTNKQAASWVRDVMINEGTTYQHDITYAQYKTCLKAITLCLYES